MTITGANNLGNLSNLGFSSEMVSAGPNDWKQLMKQALYKFGNPLVPTERHFILLYLNKQYKKA